MKKTSLIFAILAAMLVFAGTAMATGSNDGHDGGDSGGTTVNETIEVTVDAGQDSHDVNNYGKWSRQLPNTQFTPQPIPESHHYAAPSMSFSFIPKNEMAKQRRVFTRAQLEQIVAGKEFKFKSRNLMGFSFQAKPNDMIIVMAGVPEGKVLINMGLPSTFSEENYDDSFELMAACALDALNMGSKSLLIYGEGVERILKNKGWSIGIGVGGAAVAKSEMVAGVGNTGFGIGRSSAKYEHPPYLHTNAGRLYDREMLYNIFLDFRNRFCKDGKPAIPDTRIKATDAASVDAMVIEDYMFGKLMEYGCTEIPDELKLVEESSGPVEETEATPAPAKKEEAPAEPTETKADVKRAPVPNVYFDLDKSNIRQDQANSLSAQIQWAVQNGPAILKSGQKIIIVGRCSKEASYDYNAGLGRKRAWAVAMPMMQAMKNAGATDEMVKALVLPVSASKDLPTSTSLPENRRVEIYVGTLVSE